MYSLFTDTSRGAGIFTDYGELPPVAESWRRLVPEDARIFGRWLVRTYRQVCATTDRVLQLGMQGHHIGMPEAAGPVIPEAVGCPGLEDLAARREAAQVAEALGASAVDRTALAGVR